MRIQVPTCHIECYYPSLGMLSFVLFLSLPIISQAVDEEAQFRQATQQELSQVSQQLKSSTVDSNWLKTQVEQQINLDIKTLKQVSSKITSHPTATWSFKTNKLLLILEHTKSYFKQYASQILSGDIPSELKNYWDKPRWMSLTNIDDLAFKASWVLALRKLNQTINPEQSAILHSTPMPADLEQSLQNLSFAQDRELTFIHGGYAFGGQRQDNRYLQYGSFGKTFGPQDCSSWMSKLIGAQTAYSTVDFADYKNPKLQRLVTPKTVSSIHDLTPGMIWVTRNGNAGHLNLVTGVDISQNRVTVIEYARNLPEYEGFGYRNVSFSPRPSTTKDYWFLPNNPQTRSDSACLHPEPFLKP